MASRIGTSVRAARERLGWSREALAYHSGVSWSAIAQIERGRRTDIRLSSLSALARALDVSIDHLVGHGARSAAPAVDHRVLVYGSDEHFLAAVIPFLRAGIERSEPSCVVTSRANVELVGRALGPDAERVEYADSSLWYASPLDALRRYREYLDERIAAGSSWVRIVGEPVWGGRSKTEMQEWMRYESIINLSFACAPTTILCPYDTRSVPAELLVDAQCTHPYLARVAGADSSREYRTPEEFLLTTHTVPNCSTGKPGRSDSEV